MIARGFAFDREPKVALPIHVPRESAVRFHALDDQGEGIGALEGHVSFPHRRHQPIRGIGLVPGLDQGRKRRRKAKSAERQDCGSGDVPGNGVHVGHEVSREPRQQGAGDPRRQRRDHADHGDRARGRHDGDEGLLGGVVEKRGRSAGGNAGHHAKRGPQSHALGARQIQGTLGGHHRAQREDAQAERDLARLEDAEGGEQNDPDVIGVELHRGRDGDDAKQHQADRAPRVAGFGPSEQAGKAAGRASAHFSGGGRIARHDRAGEWYNRSGRARLAACRSPGSGTRPQRSLGHLYRGPRCCRSAEVARGRHRRSSRRSARGQPRQSAKPPATTRTGARAPAESSSARTALPRTPPRSPGARTCWYTTRSSQSRSPRAARATESQRAGQRR